MTTIETIKEQIEQWEKENPEVYGKISFEVNYKAGKPTVINVGTGKSIKVD